LEFGVDGLFLGVGLLGSGIWGSSVGLWVEGFELGVHGVWGLGFGVQHSRCGAKVLEFRFQDSGFRVQGSGLRFKGSGFRVQGSGFEFRV